MRDYFYSDPNYLNKKYVSFGDLKSVNEILRYVRHEGLQMKFPWEKLDSELDTIYSDYLKMRQFQNTKKKPADNVTNYHPVLEINKGLYLVLQYVGALDEIEAKGFKTTTREDENTVNGYLSFADFDKVVPLPGVISLFYGDEAEADLDLSIPDIKANLIRDVDHVSGQVSGTVTGSGVIIGIIDSGIDFRHPTFFKANTAVLTTRILRIWDMGLVSEAGETSPDVSRLHGGGGTYGVEYTADDINNELRNEPGRNVRHRDCNGHGSHVAAIAAGAGDSGTHFNYAGVAPEADLIIVKYLSLEKFPSANPLQRYKDAVTYILKMAREILPEAPKPVVINASFGSSLGPHDGLTDEERFLNDTFKPGGGANTYWDGCVHVNSAGNDGTFSSGQPKKNHAVITVPQGGIVVVPFFMFEGRRAVRTDRRRCCEYNNTAHLQLDFWYKSSDNQSIEASLQLPGDSNWIGPVTKPAADNSYNSESDEFGDSDQYEYTFKHGSKVGKRPDNGPSQPAMDVVRNNIHLKITPDGDRITEGVIYKVKLEHTGAENSSIEIHVWCQRATNHGFKLAQDSLQPSEVQVKTENLIGSSKGGVNTVTVASSKDADDSLVSSSSRGPLVDYSGHGPISNKPDLAAPGDKILSARSHDERSVLSIPGRVPQYITKGGTSMASPHVAGAVALMLEKNGSLSPNGVKQILKDAGNVRDGTDPLPSATDDYAYGYGSGLLDVKESVDDA